MLSPPGRNLTWLVNSNLTLLASPIFARAIGHDCHGELPVSIMPGLDWNQEGNTRPLKVEKPKIRRLREELRSTYCRGESKTMFSSGSVEEKWS